MNVIVNNDYKMLISEISDGDKPNLNSRIDVIGSTPDQFFPEVMKSI